MFLWFKETVFSVYSENSRLVCKHTKNLLLVCENIEKQYATFSVYYQKSRVEVLAFSLPSLHFLFQKSSVWRVWSEHYVSNSRKTEG